MTLDTQDWSAADLSRVRRAAALGARNAEIRRAYRALRAGDVSKGDAIARLARRHHLSEDTVNGVLWPR